MQPKGLPPVQERTAKRAAFPMGSLPIRVRDHLAEIFADAFGARGTPGHSPGALALVTVLQFPRSAWRPVRVRVLRCRSQAHS